MRREAGVAIALLAAAAAPGQLPLPAADAPAAAVQSSQELARFRHAVADRRLVYVDLPHGRVDAVVVSRSPVDGQGRCFVNPPLELIANADGGVSDGDRVFPVAGLQQILLGFHVQEGASPYARRLFYVLDVARVSAGRVTMTVDGDMARLYDIRADAEHVTIAARAGTVEACFTDTPADRATTESVLAVLNHAATPVVPVGDDVYRELDTIYGRLSNPELLASRTVAAALPPSPPGRTLVLAELARAPGATAGIGAIPVDFAGCHSAGSAVAWYRTVSCGDRPIAATVSFADPGSAIARVLDRLARSMFNDRRPVGRVTFHLSSEPTDAAIFVDGERQPYRTIADLELPAGFSKAVQIIKQGFQSCVLEPSSLARLLTTTRRWGCRLRRERASQRR